MSKTKIEWCDYYKGWVEALIDGEGSLTIVKEKRPHFSAGVTFKPQMQIGNKSLPLLEQAKSVIGGGCIYKKRTDSFYYYVANSGILRGFLPKINLIVKEYQRRLLIDALVILNRHVDKNKPRTPDELNKLNAYYVSVRMANGRNAI